MPHRPCSSQVEQAVGHVDRDDAIIVRHDEHRGHAGRPTRARGCRTPGWRAPRHTGRERCRSPRRPPHPMSSCTQRASGSSIGGRVERDVGEPFGRGAVGDLSELDDATAVRGDSVPFDGQLTVDGAQVRPRFDPGGIVAEQLDEHLASQPVGPPDVSDLEESRGDRVRAPRGACRRRVGHGAGRAVASDVRSVVEELDVDLDIVLRRGTRATVRMLAAVRPRRPITRPRSPSPTRTLSVRRRPESSASTVTASGSSTIDLTMCVSTATAVGAPASDSVESCSTVSVSLTSRPWRPRTGRWRRRSRAACGRARSAGRRRRATSRPCRCRP